MDADTVMTAVRQVIVIVPTVSIQVHNLRDPKDEIIIAAAVSGGANAIITEDQDLLVLVAFQGIPILSPRDFLASE
jgi:uncharacterized protein